MLTENPGFDNYSEHFHTTYRNFTDDSTRQSRIRRSIIDRNENRFE
jgi:hypothetical protein